MEEEIVTVCGQVGIQTPAQMLHDDWVRELEVDPIIAQIIQLYHENQLFQSKVASDDS